MTSEYDVFYVKAALPNMLQDLTLRFLTLDSAMVAEFKI
jgi:hypothetical protein